MMWGGARGGGGVAMFFEESADGKMKAFQYYGGKGTCPGEENKLQITARASRQNKWKNKQTQINKRSGFFVFRTRSQWL